MRAALAVAFLCAACAAEPVGVESGAIVGGAAEPGYPAVVAVINERTGGLCTGTIVSPWVVLTAKHCVLPADSTELYPAEDFVIGVGPGIDAFDDTLRVAATATTDGTWRVTDVGGVAGALLNVDVGVLQLASPAPVEPIAVRREPLVGIPAGELTAVGFGGRPEGGIGQKWRTSTTIVARTGYVLVGGPAVCGGDSGGPLIAGDGTIVAVASLAGHECGTGQSAFNLIDPFVELVDAAERDALACDPFAPETWPDGWYCARAGCGGAFRRGVPGTLEWGEPCDDDTECVTLHCVDPGDGARRCLGSCRWGAGECADGEACAALEGGCGACVPASEISPHALGEPCGRDGDCASGECHRERLGNRYCTRPCAGGCPTGFDCRDDACVRDADRADFVCDRVGDGGLACERPVLLASGGGGCAVSVHHGPASVWMLALLGLLRRRRT